MARRPPRSPRSLHASGSPSPAPPLTERQERVIAFIRDFAARRGYPPTHAEIAAGLGFKSPNAATENVQRLATTGVLVIEPGLSRGLRGLGGPGRAARPGSPGRPGTKAAAGAIPQGLPLVGEVAAGQPILAQENVERVVDVDPAIFRPRADYLLRARGESMIDAGIRPGDLLAVHKTANARDGQIAVVRLDDDVTVKRFRTYVSAGRSPGPKQVVLEPANAALSPVVVDPSRVTVAIEGVVVGLLRLGSP